MWSEHNFSMTDMMLFVVWFVICNKWFGAICEDINCLFCVNRPDTPLEALAWEEVYDEGQSSGGKDWRRKNYQHKNAGQMRHRKR